MASLKHVWMVTPLYTNKTTTTNTNQGLEAKVPLNKEADRTLSDSHFDM